MQVRKLCHRSPVTIDEEASALAAATVMRDEHVGALVVTRAVAAGPRIVGMLTDRDLAIHAVTRPVAPTDLAVKGLMRRHAVAVPASADIGDAAHAMREEGVRRMLVVDAAHRLVGVVSLDDLIVALADGMGDVSHALRRGADREQRTVHRPVAEDPTLLLPQEALVARWRQITAS